MRSAVDVGAQISNLLARHRAAQEAALTARRQLEAERRAAERSRLVRFQSWLKARGLLHAVVDEIEAELAPAGFYLGVTDDVPHPDDLAAVEIRLCRLGHPCDTILDIVVEAQGRQILRDLGGEGAPRRKVLPPVTRVTADDYRNALLTYVDGAMTGLVSALIPIGADHNR